MSFQVFRSAYVTCLFELRRSLNIQRAGASIMLTLFPPTMLGLLVFGAVVNDHRMRGHTQASVAVAEIALFLIILMVGLVLLLSLMLWATPNVNSELEGKSWSFIACRPGGRLAIFLGKMLTSTIVAFLVSTVAMTICLVIAYFQFGLANPPKTWFALARVFLLASAVYSAIFSMIGTIFIKRAMVVSASYLIGSELLLASLPGSLINKLTLRYHLQELGIEWVGWFVPQMRLQDYEMIYGKGLPMWGHLSILLGIGLLATLIGCYIITNREYVVSDQS